MDAARSAIHKFTSRTGHRTHVEEAVNPAVTRETVKPTRHEESTEAVDREVHQHHYHTTVQPITHREVLPEKHTHNLLDVVKREFHHGDHESVKQRVSEELSLFENSTVTHETHHTSSVAPAVTGEHVHHHVHETVQPVIHKETIQPEVVHTTIPIHEVHHAEAQHHEISSLPMKTLEEFTKIGGILTGSRGASHEDYEGAPRPYNKNLGTTVEKALANIHLGGHHDHHDHHNHHGVDRHRDLDGTDGVNGIDGIDGARGPRGPAATAPGATTTNGVRSKGMGSPTTTTTTNTTTSTSGPFTSTSHAKRDSGIGDVNGNRASYDSVRRGDGLTAKTAGSPVAEGQSQPLR